MNKQIKIAFYFFILGIALDLLSTFIGVMFFNIAEANPLGILFCFIAGLVIPLILHMILEYNSPEKKWQIILINSLLYIIGSWRLIIGILNFIFMR